MNKSASWKRLEAATDHGDFFVLSFQFSGCSQDAHKREFDRFWTRNWFI